MNLSHFIIGNKGCECETVAFKLYTCLTSDQVVEKLNSIATRLYLSNENKNHLQMLNETWLVKLTTLLKLYRSQHGNNAKLVNFVNVLYELDLTDAGVTLFDHFNATQDEEPTVDLEGCDTDNTINSTDDAEQPSQSQENDDLQRSSLLSNQSTFVMIPEQDVTDDQEIKCFHVFVKRLAEYPAFLLICFCVFLLVIVKITATSMYPHALSPKIEVDESKITDAMVSVSKASNSVKNETRSFTNSSFSFTTVVVDDYLIANTTSLVDLIFAKTDTVKRNVSASSFTELNVKMSENIQATTNLFLTVSSTQDWQQISPNTNSWHVPFLHVYLLENLNILSSILFHLSKVEELVVHLGKHFLNTFSDIELNFKLKNMKSVTFRTDPGHILNDTHKKYVNITHDVCRVFPNLETLNSEVPILYTSFVRLGTCEKLKNVEAFVVFSKNDSFWDASSIFDQPSLKSMVLDLSFDICPPEEKVSLLRFGHIQQRIPTLTLTSNCNLYTKYTHNADIKYSSHYENKTVH